MMTDPVGDMLTRIRNAGMARHLETRCPASKLKRSVATVLQSAGFIGEIRIEAEGLRTFIVMEIRYDELGAALIDGIRRVSKPGRRVYVGKDDVPTVRHGLGVAVLSTSKGILSDIDARAASVGGEVLCEVW